MVINVSERLLGIIRPPKAQINLRMRSLTGSVVIIDSVSMCSLIWAFAVCICLEGIF